MICALVLVAGLMSPLLSARADVLIEPNNDFYHRNSSRCEYMGRFFYANGEDGYISLKLEPRSAREVAAIENGEKLYIMFTYDDDGVEWGVTEIVPEKGYEERQAGWVPMDRLHLVYDSISFADDHVHEFVESAFDITKLDFDGDLVMWTWPGSGQISWIFERQYFVEETNMGEGSTIYIDADGREWGFLAYFYGHRSFWVCLDDPSNQEIPAFNPAPDLVLWQRMPPPEPNQSAGVSGQDRAGVSGQDGGQDGRQDGLSLPTIAIILVAAVALVTVVLIRVFWKKETKKDSEE